MRARIRRALWRVIQNPDRVALLRAIWRGGGPVYAGDPQDPAGVIQIHADGRRIRGRFIGRQFVPRDQS